MSAAGRGGQLLQPGGGWCDRGPQDGDSSGHPLVRLSVAGLRAEGPASGSRAGGAVPVQSVGRPAAAPAL